MKKIRVAVIGAGHLGQHHVRIYAKLPTVDLVGVIDIDKNKEKLARQYHTPFFSNYHEILGKVDAVSIATPTPLHYEIGLKFLQRGVCVLVEKPLSETLSQAKRLTKIAGKNSLILQAGHIERFNPAVMKLTKLVHNPRYIEAERLSPYPNRSTEISVVLDLMIHDLDIVLSLVKSALKRIEGIGLPVLSREADMAYAHLIFKNGCMVNLKASRLSPRPFRHLRIFQEDSYISLDYAQQKIIVCRRKKKPLGISTKVLRVPSYEPLEKELSHFIDCVRRHKKPLVSGEEAADALGLALKIQQKIKERREE